MEKKKNIIAGTLITGAVIAASGLSAVAQAKEDIRPFHIKVPQTKLDDMRRRVMPMVLLTWIAALMQKNSLVNMRIS